MKLLYFSAPWCGPCVTFGPIVDKVTKELDYDVLKIDPLEDILTAFQYKIESIPTLVLANAGKEVQRHIGPMSEDRLRDWLQ